jgi:8-oxo-dGTP diphosphatase
MTHTYEYPLPAVTVDMVVFTIRNGELKVLLIRRRDDPYRGSWALPGGFVDVGNGHVPGDFTEQGESLDKAAERELLEETGLRRERDQVFLEQLYTFGRPGRDPRGRVISVAYYALISPEAYHRVEAGDDAVEAEWVDIWAPAEMGDYRPPSDHILLTVDAYKYNLAFDHAQILRTAVERIRGKIDYDPRLVRALLPEEFTSKEFRRVHEIVKGESYDSSNFSKRFRRMVEDGRFVELDETKETRGSGRPARLYRFAEEA